MAMHSKCFDSRQERLFKSPFYWIKSTFSLGFVSFLHGFHQILLVQRSCRPVPTKDVIAAVLRGQYAPLSRPAEPRGGSIDDLGYPLAIKHLGVPPTHSFWDTPIYGNPHVNYHYLLIAGTASPRSHSFGYVFYVTIYQAIYQSQVSQKLAASQNGVSPPFFSPMGMHHEKSCQVTILLCEIPVFPSSIPLVYPLVN